jgi:hypothetical protein
MRIAMVAAELAPHEVHAIAPISPVADPQDYSLAKRLRPIEITSTGRTWAFDRFDGRTTAGLEVHLLGNAERVGQGAGLGFWDAFCKAAADVLGSLDTAGLCCASWNAECAPVAAADRAGPAAAASHLLTICKLDEASLERIAGTLDELDQVVIAGRLLADGIAASGFEPLSSMLADGRAHSVPMALPPAPPIHRSDKASAKAALQASVGLPVRRDVPLLVLAEPPGPETAFALARFLAGDVQAAAPPGAQIDDLRARYRDRLALLRSRPTDDTLLAADGCLFVGDPTLAKRCMSRGAIPVTVPDCAEGVVDLEPSLESGSGMIASAFTDRALAEALVRLAAAFCLGDRFCALTERIPSYVATWRDVSRLYEQLVEAGPTVDPQRAPAT